LILLILLEFGIWNLEFGFFTIGILTPHNYTTFSHNYIKQNPLPNATFRSNYTNTSIMKKLLFALLFFAGTTVAMAQVDKVDDQQENVQDKIQQEPQRPAQIDMERNARIEAQRIENERVAAKKAKKLAKANAKAAVVQDTLKVK
jgi:hypothetical protein